MNNPDKLLEIRLFMQNYDLPIRIFHRQNEEGEIKIFAVKECRVYEIGQLKLFNQPEISEDKNVEDMSEEIMEYSKFISDFSVLIEYLTMLTLTTDKTIIKKLLANISAFDELFSKQAFSQKYYILLRKENTIYFNDIEIAFQFAKNSLITSKFITSFKKTFYQTLNKLPLSAYELTRI